jgi:hypothetical protein
MWRQAQQARVFGRALLGEISETQSSKVLLARGLVQELGGRRKKLGLIQCPPRLETRQLRQSVRLFLGVMFPPLYSNLLVDTLHQI